MRVRPLTEDDIPRLREIYDAQGWKYEFPNFFDPQFVVKAVLIDDTGAIVNAVCARQTVELYMLADNTWRTPHWRLEAVKKMHGVMSEALAMRGFTDAHCWLPPEIARSFGKRLARTFQWVKNTWPCYSREI